MRQFVTFSNIASAVALILAAVAIWQTERHMRLQTESRVVFSIGRDYEQENVAFKKYNGDRFGATFVQRYGLTINNIGQQDASLISWHVVASLIHNGETWWGLYAGMNPRFFKDKTEITPPFSIKVNNPTRMILEVGVRVPQSAWKKVKHELAFDKKYNYGEVERMFMDAGWPQFGQLHLTRRVSYPSLATRHYGPGSYYQKFRLYATKGSGDQVCAQFSHAISRAFLQGENGDVLCR